MKILQLISTSIFPICATTKVPFLCADSQFDHKKVAEFIIHIFRWLKPIWPTFPATSLCQRQFASQLWLIYGYINAIVPSA